MPDSLPRNLAGTNPYIGHNPPEEFQTEQVTTSNAMLTQNPNGNGVLRPVDPGYRIRNRSDAAAQYRARRDAKIAASKGQAPNLNTPSSPSTS